MMQNLDKKNHLEILEKAKKYLKEEDWDLVSNSDNIILEKKAFYDICPIHCYRANATIDKNYIVLSEKIWMATEETEKENDSSIILWRILESGENYRICIQRNEMIWPIWPRETVFSQSKIVDENIIWIVATSTEHDIAVSNDNFVRTKLHMSIYGFEKINDNSTNIYKLFHVDPNGSIPASIVNMQSSNLIKTIKKWKYE